MRRNSVSQAKRKDRGSGKSCGDLFLCAMARKKRLLCSILEKYYLCPVRQCIIIIEAKS